MQSAGDALGQYGQNAEPERCGSNLRTAWQGLPEHSVRTAVPKSVPPVPRHRHCTHHVSSEILRSIDVPPDQSHLLSAERHQAILLEQSTSLTSHYLLAQYYLDRVPALQLQPPAHVAVQTAARPRAICYRENRHHFQSGIEDLLPEIHREHQEGNRIRRAAAWDPRYQHAGHAPNGVSSTVAPICLDSRQQISRMSVHGGDAVARHGNPAADPRKRSLFADSILPPDQTRTQRFLYLLPRGHTTCPIGLG